MKKVKTLLVDNETSTIESLKNFLTNIGNIEICGICNNGEEAINKIEEQKPQIVLLDIELPKLNGFEVINNVSGIDGIYWIFVTAYNKYAVKAFEVDVLDYILKPVKKQRVVRAVSRAMNYLNNSAEEELISSSNKMKDDEILSKLLVKDSKKYILINVEDIYFFEASGNYIRVHLSDKKYLIRSTLKYLESKLDPRKFYRIHKSTIVNINFVNCFEQWFTGDYEVLLENGKKLKMSRNYKEVLEQFQ